MGSLQEGDKQEKHSYSMIGRPPRSPLLPSSTLFQSPPRASASSVKSGTTRSNVATMQTPAIAPRRLACDAGGRWRSEEHTSELQSQSNLVCRLLLEKKKHKI